MQPSIERVTNALNDFRKGKMVILTDHPDRENEGDLVMPATKITPEAMNFIIRHSSGIVCLSLLEEQLSRLNLPFMVPPHENSSFRGTPFMVSIDAKEGITTGVSAEDRVKTIKAAIHEHAKPSDLDKPGHIFPLCARSGGVLERAGHTEGSIDLARLAGLGSSAVLCEVMNADGTMASGDQLVAFANEHHIAMLSIDDIIHYRRYYENLIEEETSIRLPLQLYGEFQFTVMKEKITGHEHIMLEKPSISEKKLVRIHSACVTGDLLGSMRCDCYQQLQYSLKCISEEGGLLIYLTNHEGRGIGLFNKIKAYALQEKGWDTIEANEQLGLPVDSRSYYFAASILRSRQLKEVRLLTNNPEKVDGLKKYGISVTRETIPAFCNQYNNRYLQTKKNKLHHQTILDDLNMNLGEV